MSQLQAYTKAMRSGNVDACILIEQKFDLYGYPPEVVSVALKAVDEGREPCAAVEAYLAGCNCSDIQRAHGHHFGCNQAGGAA